MRFLGCKFTQNALAAGVPTRTPLGELKRSPAPLADFRGPLRGRRKGREGKEGGVGEGKEEEGYWEGKEGGEGSLRHWRWGIDALSQSVSQLASNVRQAAD